MPIKISNQESNIEIAWLNGDDWDLPTQLDTLEMWLQKTGTKLPKGKYVVDIGFDIRPEAFGGGGNLSIKSMKIMVDVGIEIYFSEYPNTLNETND